MENMKISMQTCPLEERVGHSAAVRMICEAGFSAIDYTMYSSAQPIFTSERGRMVREMKEIADAFGVVFNQAHSTNPSQRYGDEEFNRRQKNCVLTSIEVAAELGAPQIVVHPIHAPDLSREEQKEINFDFYSEILDHARAVGVKIAIENMWARHRDMPDRIVRNVCSDGDELCEYVDMMDSEYVVACLDVGHAGLVGERADDMIRRLGKRLRAIHVNDNDFYLDLHTLPFMGNVNFDEVCRALSDVGYSGDITFEPYNALKKIPTELYPATLGYLLEIGKYLREKIKGTKK